MLSACVVCDSRDDVKTFTTAAAYGWRELQNEPVCYPCALNCIHNPKHEPDYTFERARLEREQRC